jgi:hypothetical protein
LHGQAGQDTGRSSASNSCLSQHSGLSGADPLLYVMVPLSPTIPKAPEASRFADRHSGLCASALRHGDRDPKVPSAPQDSGQPHETDVSVDSVHTPFGRTNRAQTAPSSVRRSPSRKISYRSREVMLCPQTRTMNRCWPPTTNPTEPERGTTQTQPQQAEGPLARDLNPPSHTSE